MMPPVAGAAVTAMPAASSTMATTSTAYDVLTPTRVRMLMPRATSAKPYAMVGPEPIRSASTALRGETSA